MARDHKISLGVHIVGLAYRHGHATVDAVWQHPVNESLRAIRADPAVLAEGDVVHVPDAAPRVFKGLQTRRHHDLVVELPIPQVRVVLLRPGGVPFAGLQCTVSFDDQVERPTTDEHGCLQFEINPDTETVTLMFDLHIVELRVAHLQPVDTETGCVARLTNIGYAPGEVDGAVAADAYALRSAVEEFQCDHGLDVDGVLSEETRQELVRVHGA